MIDYIKSKVGLRRIRLKLLVNLCNRQLATGN